jgi:hypothetical protein
MPKLSRRHLVTTAAALPALAIPALASEVIGPNHPDAELLRLGVELETVIIEWRALRAKDAVTAKAMDAACDAAGLPDRGPPDFSSLDDYYAYMRRRAAAMESVTDHADLTADGGSIAWEELDARVQPLIEAIMALQPRTIAGLGVVARTFTLHHAEQWEPFAADDKLQNRQFMEAVCAFAGVVPVPLSREAVRS